MSDRSLRGARVLVMGIGRRAGGVGAIRYAVDAGAEVRVTDQGDPDRFAAVVAEFHDTPVRFVLGRHDEADFRWADVVIRNPDVRRDSPYLRVAEAHGARVEMEMTLFLRASPAPTIGVTGTKGKTTTTMALHGILRERWPSSVVAGNMGYSALARLGDVEPGVPVALELSSFQLEGLGEHALAPHVAVLTNVRTDHLDRYPSLDAYRDAKAQIVRHQHPDDWKVYPADDPVVAALVAGTPGRAVTFGDAAPLGNHALFVDGGRLVARWDGATLDLGPVAALRVPGAHNRRNALAAAGAALAVGVEPDAIRRGLARFEGVRHRLELVATVAGVDYVNDTTATTPDAAAAALEAYTGRPVVAIVGGFDKGLDAAPLAAALDAHAARVVLLDGTGTPGLARALRGAPTGPLPSMRDAVARAAALATPGAVVLLAPGYASFGLFVDEFDRGDQFRAAVHDLAARAAGRDAVTGT
jgi:UDP-N-acetylmuramoylalanine--D-glutamate ligase